MERRFETPDPVRVYVEVGRGSVRLATHAAPTTVVTLDGERAEDVLVTAEDGQVQVVGPRGWTGFVRDRDDDPVRVAVTAPEGSTAVVRNGAADVHSTGTWRSLAVKSGSGDVTVDEPGGKVVVEAGSGDVRLGPVQRDTQVKAGSGDVRIDRLSGSTSVKTGTGDLEVGTSQGSLHWATGSGDLTVHRAERGTVRVTTAAGEVRLGVPAGTPVWTALTSLTGSVTSRLPATGPPAEGQQHLEVRGATVAGNVTLFPATVEG